MEGERINHNWCMGVVGHRYGGLVVGRHAGQSRGGDMGALPECVVKALTARGHRFPGAQL